MYYDDVKFLKNGFFDRINNHESYILDSNIVIKLRDLFYSPHKMSIEEINYYIALLEFFQDKDVLPGIAIQELSWNFERYEIDQTKHTRLVNALSSLFSYDYYTYSRIKDQREFISDIKPFKGSKKEFNSLLLNTDGNIHLLPSFCIILKYHHVMQIYSDNNRRYIEICNFIINTLKLVGGYELTLITELLFSQSDSKTKIIKNMLKIDGGHNCLQQVWNSCWDIFFLRFITAFAANTLSNNTMENIYNPILVTRDKNLYTIGNQLENNKDIVIDNQVYPGITGRYDFSKEATELVQNMSLKMLQTKEERLKIFGSMNGDQLISHWKGIIKDIEIELIKIFSKF